MKKYGILFLILLLTLKLSSQDKYDREIVIKSTNVKKLQQIADEFLETQNLFKYKEAKKIKIDKNGGNKFFSYYDKLGSPVYYSLENESSAIRSKIDRIRTGGVTGLDLDGRNIEFGLWDSGMLRSTHQEFNNITKVDNISGASHVTHIAGILIVSGVKEESKGMAPGVTIKAYSTTTTTTTNWNYEVPVWAAAGGLISSHSYIISNPAEDYEKYGVYNVFSKLWDEISNNVPYLVMCTGASNNGNKYYNLDRSKYDLLTSNKLGKNSIVVGAGIDALNYISPRDIRQAYYTNWGPTDDWRIKPNITAVGSNSYSTRNSHDTHYGTGQVSSYTAPIVSGGLALLQEHYHNNNVVYMKAATAKALILSTTDEADTSDGSDFAFGWGLFNAEEAANVITNKGVSAIISELTLNEDESYAVTIKVDGTEPLTVALSWNDPAGTPLYTDVHNDATPVLVNGLDVRVTSDSNTYFPWFMEPNSTHDNYTDAASKGDNYRDNIEIVNVKIIEAGEYIVNISHKGTLKNGSQDFSLIINGIEKGTLSNSEINSEDNYAVYPNPTGDYLKIKPSLSKSEIRKVNLYNVIDQKTLEAQFYNQKSIELDVSNMPKGIYMLKGYDENNSNVLLKNNYY